MQDVLTIPRPARRTVLQAVVVLAGTLALGGSLLGLWLTSRGGGDPSPHALSRTAFAEETGIHVVRVAVVAGGGVVDVRYLVHGHDGAEQQAGGQPLALLDEETGVLLADGVHGRHAGSSSRPDAVHYVLLSNTEGALERGETASVVVGDVRLEHVPVE